MRKAHIILPSIPDRSIDGISGSITVIGDDYHHLVNVLRMKTGDRVVAVDGSLRYETEISNISRDSMTLKVIDISAIKKNPFYVSMILPVMAPNKMEYMVQKVAELGVDEIVLTFFNRCEQKAKRTDIAKREARLLRISREAVNQSFNSIIPTIRLAVSLDDAVGLITKPYLLIACMESGADFTIGEVMSKAGIGCPDYSDDSKKIVLVIGPEGSMDDEERSFLADKGAFKVTINQSVLRSETAAVAVLAIVRNYELERVKSCAGDL